MSEVTHFSLSDSVNFPPRTFKTAPSCVILRLVNRQEFCLLLSLLIRLPRSIYTSVPCLHIWNVITATRVSKKHFYTVLKNRQISSSSCMIFTILSWEAVTTVLDPQLEFSYRKSVKDYSWLGWVCMQSACLNLDWLDLAVISSLFRTFCSTAPLFFRRLA